MQKIDSTANGRRCQLVPSGSAVPGPSIQPAAAAPPARRHSPSSFHGLSHAAPQSHHRCVSAPPRRTRVSGWTRQHHVYGYNCVWVGVWVGGEASRGMACGMTLLKFTCDGAAHLRVCSRNSPSRALLHSISRVALQSQCPAGSA